MLAREAPSEHPRRGHRSALLVPVLLVLALAASVRAAQPPEATASEPGSEGAAEREVIFTDEATASGVDFQHFNGMTGAYYFPEIMGSGGALLDFDGDGDLDVYLSQGRLFDPAAEIEDALVAPAHPLPLSDRLYRNDLGTGPDGEPLLRFTDVTAASGLAATGYGMGAAAGDIDNDGWVDVYVTNHGPNQLWHNQGDGTFREITAESGTGAAGWTTAALLFDFDRDGLLDLYAGNYVDSDVGNHKICQTKATARTYCSPALFEPVPDHLYRNQGEGSFEEVTARMGVDEVYGPALGAVAGDFDEDGWLDLYVTNDGEPNQLWLNEEGKAFRDEALLAGAAVSGEGKPEASMGVDAEDFDGDGDLDLFMTHLDRETNTLYVNEGGGMFVDRTVRMGLASPSKRYTGFGTAWIDFDNDGDLDILVVNGEVDTIDALYRSGDPYPFAQRNQLFENVGDGRYREVTERAGPAFESVEVSRGALFGDLDNDGDTDVVVTNNNGPARVLINRVGQDAPWVGVRTVTGPGRRDAYGARIELLRDGAPTMWRRVRADGSYASTSDPRVLFGLGGGQKLDRVRVHWPSGRIEEWEAPEPGRYTTLVEGSGKESGGGASAD